MNIKEINTQVGKAIAVQVDPENGDEIKYHLSELSSLQASNNAAWAYARKIEKLKMVEAMKNIQPTLSATDKKIHLSALIADASYDCDLAEFQNKSLHYKIEAMRSILSSLKQQLQNSYNQ